MAVRGSERMWRTAYELARSGLCANMEEIVAALQHRGFPTAPQVLANRRVREELDRVCAEARAQSDRAPKC